MRLGFVLTLAIFGSVAAAVDYYTDAYDNTNIDAIMRNERLFKSYLRCLLDKGSCTADARAMRTILPDAMASNCARCNVAQRKMARKISRYLMEVRPEAWAQLVEKYDPNNIHMEAFEKFIAEEE